MASENQVETIISECRSGNIEHFYLLNLYAGEHGISNLAITAAEYETWLALDREETEEAEEEEEE